MCKCISINILLVRLVIETVPTYFEEELHIVLYCSIIYMELTAQKEKATFPSLHIILYYSH